jgi:hypothetical protein
MATTVAQTYTAAQNMSVTHKEGRLVKVTLWTTGNGGKDTVRIS